MGCGKPSKHHAISPDGVIQGTRATQVVPEVVLAPVMTANEQPIPVVQNQSAVQSANDNIDGHILDDSGLYYRDGVTNASNLCSAVKKGDIGVVRELIEAGVDANVKGMWSSTPLIISLQFGYDDIANYFLDIQGVDVNHRNEKGGGALLFACMEGKTQLCERLLSLGAELNPPVSSSIYNPNIDRNLACTPLSIACINGHVEIVRVLTKSGCDVDTTFQFSITKSIMSSNSKDVKPVGLTPIMVAAAFGRLSVVEELLKRKANCLLVDSEKSSLLHHSTRSGKTAKDLILALKNAEIISPSLLSLCDGKGDTALHCACESKLFDVAQLLLELGCQSSIKNLAGSTPLHIAVKRRSIELVNMLLDFGADPLMEDNQGVSAAQAASQLRKDAPVYLRMEEAATAWRAKKAIDAVALDAATSGGVGTILAEVKAATESPLSPTTHTAPQAVGTKLDSAVDLAMFRTPSRNKNQVEDLIDSAASACSGVDEALSRIADGAGARQGVMASAVAASAVGPPLTFSEATETAPTMQQLQPDKSDSLVVIVARTSNGPEEGGPAEDIFRSEVSRYVMEGRRPPLASRGKESRGRGRPVPGAAPASQDSESEIAADSRFVSNSSRSSTSNPVTNPSVSGKPKLHDWAGDDDVMVMPPIKDSEYFSTPERVNISRGKNRSTAALPTTTTAAAGLGSGNGSNSRPGSSSMTPVGRNKGSQSIPDLTPSAVFPVFETPIRGNSRGAKVNADMALLSI